MNELMIDRMNNEDFSMQDLMNVVGRNAMTTESINKQMGIVASAVSTLRTDVNEMRSDIDDLKLNSEITYVQHSELKRVAKRRIVDILGTPDSEDYHKYAKSFFGAMYSEVRKRSELADPIARTPKRGYQHVIDELEAWIPKLGITGLKEKVDIVAKNKREARLQGYDC